MTLRRRARLVSILSQILAILGIAVPGVVVVSALGYGRYALGILLVAILGAIVVRRSVTTAYLKKSMLGSMNRYRDAVEREDEPAMRQEIEWFVSAYAGTKKAVARAIADLYSAILLVDTERFQDGMRMLEAIPRDTLPKPLHPTMLWHLAWCKANSGEPEEALLLARQLLDQPGTQFTDELIGALRGSALFYAHRYQEALSPLSEALAGDLSPYNRACAEHYLGLSLESLSRWQEARSAFQRSVGAAECKWARRSREHLAEPRRDQHALTE